MSKMKIVVKVLYWTVLSIMLSTAGIYIAMLVYGLFVKI